ncbi:MAG: LemA family protein [Candidatus Moranbacteria bacterium]|jgi:LemA protein|nr:LemA family protein [Candidatus Moranbacteria bacterium]NCA94325.1 LemA family protein [Sphingobacteriia bacterium]
MVILIVFLAIIAVIAIWGVSIYNGLVKLKNRVDEAWSDIDVQLKRRYDLIPNLISTVKGYASHESQTFEKVTEARSKAMQAQESGDAKTQAEAENMLSGTLKSIFALAENYPDLKANQNFLELQRELADTEDKIQASRRFYNGNVRDFNIKIELFPNNIFAGIMNFTKREFFEIENESERENVKVEF